MKEFRLLLTLLVGLPVRLLGQDVSDAWTNLNNLYHQKSESDRVLEKLEKEQTPDLPIPTLDPNFPRADESHIVGQIFITLENGGSVKLSDIEVRAYPKEYFDRFLEWKKAKYDDLRHKHFDILKDHKEDHAVDIVEKTYLVRASLHLEILEIVPWNNLPAAPFKTVSDADGRFRLNHYLKQPYYIFAFATRKVDDDDTEVYRWIIPSDKIDLDSPLYLTKKNRTPRQWVLSNEGYPDQ